MDWDHADSDCRSKGGYLVDIQSSAEQAFVYNSLNVSPFIITTHIHDGFILFLDANQDYLHKFKISAFLLCLAVLISSKMSCRL